MEDAKSVLAVLRKKYTHSCPEMLIVLELQGFSSITTIMRHWSWTSRFIKSAQVHPVVCTSWDWLGIRAGVHGALQRLHRNKYCMEQLTSPRRIPVRYYTTTSWQHVCWWLLNTNRSKARHSETTVAVQWEGKWVNNTHIHTDSNRQLNWHTYLSQQFLGSFPVCYILSRKTTKLFMKASIYDSMVCTVQ